jgi:methyltransferase-like protein 6
MALSTTCRMPPAQRLAPNLCRRQDGTTAYFFTPAQLSRQCEAAGFAARECDWACTRLVNRRRGVTMRRVFVHGLFQRPAAAGTARSAPSTDPLCDKWRPPDRE